MVPGTKYQDAKRPGHGLSLPPIVLAAICLGRQISRRQMSQRLMSRSQKSWPGNVPGAKSPNANCPKRQMSAGKCLSADGEPPFVSLPLLSISSRKRVFWSTNKVSQFCNVEKSSKKAYNFLQLEWIGNFFAKFWDWNGSGTERTLILGRGNGTELIPILIYTHYDI